VLIAAAAPVLAQRGGTRAVTPFPTENLPRGPRITSEKLQGIVLRLNFVELILQASDRRIIQISLPSTVKFAIRDESQRPMPTTAAGFAPGDQVTVDAEHDEMLQYRGNRILLDVRGGNDEKAAAEGTLELAFGQESGVQYMSTGPGPDPVIDAARHATVELTKSLPNFIVHQITTRYTAGPADLKSKGHKQDEVTADLVTENGQESFRNLLINGKKPKDDPSKSGSWSSGEYSSIVIEVLAPRSRTKFESKGEDTVVQRRAFKYAFAVDENHSRWILSAAGQRYLPGFSGTIWFDQETSRVLRVEMASESAPKNFPIEKVLSSVEYDYIPLGDGKYLLPWHADTVSCTRGKGGCSRNEIEFRGYKKFGAESSISFDKDPR
jgi:hypothetical protein